MATVNNLDDERLHMSPVHKRLQMSVVRVQPGLAILSMPLSEEVRGYFDGSIHGGHWWEARVSIIARSPPRSVSALSFGSHGPTALPS